MVQITINQLQISCPEGFRELSSEEKAGLKFYMDRPGTCLANPEKHIIVTVGWVKSGLASMMISEKEAARKAEEKISKAMKANEYQPEGFQDYVLDGEKASA